mgnify:CR=1 FL=1|jgi:hypothetical protein
MAKVAIVENNAVVYRGSLPRVWKNSSGIHNSKDDWDTLNEIGIFPLEEVTPSYDSDTEVLDGWTEDIQADKVVLTWNKRSLTDDEIAANAEAEATAYKYKRASEYPEIADQLDDIYHNGIDAWKATIKTTKDKYPKP